MKKKKILMIAGGVFPDASATGNICFQIAKELCQEYDVEIVSLLNTYISEKCVETEEGIRIRIERNFWFLLRRLMEKHQCKWGLYFVRAVDRLISMFILPKNTWWYAGKVKKIICNACKENQELCVVAFSEPFESQWGALKARKKNCSFQWISIFADAFALPINQRNIFVNVGKMEEMEKKVIAGADYIFVTPEIAETRKALYQDHLQKVNVLPYIIPDLSKQANAEATEQIRMTYAGRFYKDIRRPEPLLDFFSQLNMENLHLDLFTGGECESVINKYAQTSGGRIKLNGMVPKERLLQEYANSDILINMENNVKEYKPSKQYEYIGTGKPIISFYYFEPDEALRKYPLALQIHVNAWAESLEQAKKFVEEVKGKKIGFEEIISIYKDNSMQHVVSMIESCINDAF